MALHTLEIMMKVNTGEAVSSINAVENEVMKIVKNVQSVNESLKSVDASQATQSISSMNSAMEAVNVTATNLSDQASTLGSMINDAGSAFEAVDTSALDPARVAQINKEFNDAAASAAGLAVELGAVDSVLQDTGVNAGNVQQLSVGAQEAANNAEVLNNSMTQLSGVLSQIAGAEGIAGQLRDAASDSGSLLSASKELNSELSNSASSYTSMSQDANSISQVVSQPGSILNEDQAQAIAELDIQLNKARRRIGEIKDSNAEYTIQQALNLQQAMQLDDSLKGVEGVTQKIASSNAVVNSIMGEALTYTKGKMGLLAQNDKLIGKIASGQMSVSDLTQKQHAELIKIKPIIAILSKQFPELAKQAGFMNKEIEKVNEFVEEMPDNWEESKSYTEEITKHLKDMKGYMSNIASIIPGGSQFMDLFNPVKMLTDAMADLNKMYEANRSVNTNFTASLDGSYNKTEAMGYIATEAADGLALLSETQAALTSVLNSGSAAALQNRDQIVALTRATAELNAVTGLSSDEFARMGTQLMAMGGDMNQVEGLGNALINMQARGRLSTQQMSKVTGLLNKDFALLNRQYNQVDKNGKVVVSGAQRVALAMTEMGRLAAEGGGDASAAMDAMGRAMSDPISMAALLGDTMMSNDPTEQMRAMQDNAVMMTAGFRDNKFMMDQFAQSLGMTGNELESLVAAGEEFDKEAQALVDSGKAANLAAAETMLMAEASAEAADEAAANEKKQAALADASRQLSDAFDSIRIIFGNLAAAAQPYIAIVADILASPLGKTIMVITASLAALIVVVKSAVAVIGTLKAIFMATGKAASVMGQQTAPGGGMAKSLGGFFESLKKLDVKGALKGALAIAVVGAALAVGVALIGLAANLLPEGKVLELMVVLGALLIASYLLIPIGAVVGQALLGALAIAAVGAALAAGIALIGLAIGIMPANKTLELVKIIGILLIASFALALLGVVAVPAMIGALALIGVAIALAAAISILALVSSPIKNVAKSIDILGKAVSGISLKAGLALSMLAVGLVAFAVAMAGAGIIGIFVDFIDMAIELGTAMEILRGPIAGLVGIGTNAGRSLQDMATGISKFADALNQGGFLGLFTPDFVSTANQLGESMSRLQQPIANLAAIGPTGAASFSAIGKGLTDVSKALSGGGIMSFFTGDKVKNAVKLAQALSILANPIERMSQAGDGAGRMFIGLGRGLRDIAEAIDEGVDVDDAEELAQSLWKLAGPINHFMRVQANAQARTAQNAMQQQVKVIADEMRAALTAEVLTRSSDRDDEMIEILGEIRDAISGEEAAEEELAELRKMNGTLTGIMQEMMMGGSMANTVADPRYNT